MESWLGTLAIGCLCAVVAMPAAGRAQQPLASGVEATTVAADMPAGVAYDAAGNLYIALLNDHVIRRVDTGGIITTVAGTGVQGFGGDGGTATSAMLDSPAGVAVDAAGNLYIADSHNQRIREVSNGIINTIAGSGVAGFGGDGGAATSALLDLPTAVSVDSAGSLYVADTNNQRIRKIAGGLIVTVAGTGAQGFAGDGQPAVSALLDSPAAVVADPATPGRFYLSDSHNQRLRLVDTNGNISTVAGTGVFSFAGDGGAATTAALANPRGLALDSVGNLYVADADNERVREIAAGTISTVAGDGEQGFAGDIGATLSAVLDTPRAVGFTAAAGGSATIGVADTHNQRVRSVVGGAINTVAGIAPPLTEGLLLSGPATGVYGTAIGSLTATFNNAGKSASGMAVLTDGGAAAGSVGFAGNAASFNLNSLVAGLHILAVSFAGDSQNAAIASGVYLVTIAQAAQAVSFPALATPVTYSAGLTAKLTATASSGLPVTFTVTGPATVSGTGSGATLMFTGAGTVTVTATQAGNVDYPAASASQTVIVLGATPLVLTGITPATAVLGSVNLPVTVTGSGFTATSVVQLNGTALVTTFVNAQMLNAIVPQLLTVGAVPMTVYDMASAQQSAPVSLTVTAPNASAQVSVPTTSPSGQQPAVNLTLQTAYPVPLTGTFTLSFTPEPMLVDDPAIQFSTGGRSFSFVLAAGATALPAVMFQSGTVAGTITLTLTLTAQGIDVTPAAARVASITVPQQTPAVNISFTQTGANLTVTISGFSNTREASMANFTFTPAAGTSLSTTALSVAVAGIFGSWFDSVASDAYGSEFLYSQTFTLSDSNSKVQGVTVTLTNSVGNSAAASSP